MTESEKPNPYRSPNFKSEGQYELEEKFVTPQAMTGKLVVLSTFESSIEAHLFKNELENNGIRASVSNENSTAIFGATIAGSSSAFWIEVLVMEADADRALKIKAQWSSQSDGLDAGEISEWACQCGETVDEGFAVCWSCGAEHTEEAS